MLEWKFYAQIHAVQSYQKEVNDKYLESSDIQHTGPGRVTSIFRYNYDILKLIMRRNLQQNKVSGNMQ